MTFRLDRDERDRQRDRERVRQSYAVRRFVDPVLPSSSWRFVAELPDGELVGELRAHERSVHLLSGEGPFCRDRREMVLDGVLVAGPYRLLGIGRRLVEALWAEMERSEIRSVHAIVGFEGRFLVACGFRVEAVQANALRWDGPLSAGRTRRW
ncbi:GNAT family N-acetyltransferase [Micromonospora auratinigra]|uniref:Acetyltransferase (GNAT) family protein n=1 Tax=Micromonospora auratinigra TaxID=261654 RepID=A0A1A9A4W5_9ACTN|nr:GNAT family N-acetyltransferase [Micromonospora auratinigra]SBT51143.1 Acetyltransferase (GNAT) family protein [Micromonospora auratinigra]